MNYQKTTWKNREVERPRTYNIQNNDDGTITLLPAEGAILEPGTPITAQNMNNIEDGIEGLDTTLTSHLAESANKHIHSSGSNDDGKWIRFDDGTMICHNSTHTLHYKDDYLLSALWTFPDSFANRPTVLATPVSILDGRQRTSSLVAGTRNRNTSTIYMTNAERVFSTDDTATVQVCAIGRWKL